MDEQKTPEEGSSQNVNLVEPAVEQQPQEAVPAEHKQEHHEQIYNILMKEDEISWRTIILELVKSEQMDPWDINVSLLSKMFIKTLKKLKEMNLRISGKVLLAAALLLRIKSSRLVGEDMLEFDRLLASGENNEDLYAEEQGFVDGQLNNMGMTMNKDQMQLVPRTPQPRKRKVSVYDLIDALAVALNVRRRRVLNQIQTRTMNMPEKKYDISQLMNSLYEDVMNFLAADTNGKVSFTSLVPGEAKEDKIFTFIPLLHLTNARKLDLNQTDHFGEIWVTMAKEKSESSDDDLGFPKEKPRKARKLSKKKEAVKEELPVAEAALDGPVTETVAPETPEPTSSPESDSPIV